MFKKFGSEGVKAETACLFSKHFSMLPLSHLPSSGVKGCPSRRRSMYSSLSSALYGDPGPSCLLNSSHMSWKSKLPVLARLVRTASDSS